VGYDAGQVDGILGSQTQTALRNFQQARGIEATGRMNDQTNRALEIASGDRQTQGRAVNEPRSHSTAANPPHAAEGKEPVRSASENRKSVQQSMSAAQMRQLQVKLNDLGYHAVSGTHKLK
jgi:peptidoglycan hydrolase-like protein with peptidoglycan-binding domain